MDDVSVYQNQRIAHQDGSLGPQANNFYRSRIQDVSNYSIMSGARNYANNSMMSAKSNLTIFSNNVNKEHHDQFHVHHLVSKRYK